MIKFDKYIELGVIYDWKSEEGELNTSISHISIVSGPENMENVVMGVRRMFRDLEMATNVKAKDATNVKIVVNLGVESKEGNENLESQYEVLKSDFTSWVWQGCYNNTVRPNMDRIVSSYLSTYSNTKDFKNLSNYYMEFVILDGSITELPDMVSKGGEDEAY